MLRYLVKIKDKYFDYLSVFDAPVTKEMTLKELQEYYLREYGELDLKTQFPQRLERVEQKGTSSFEHQSVEELSENKCAGRDGSYLTFDEIYEKYCL